MAKEKKVETRDILYEQLAQDILSRGDQEEVVRYKEGLRVDINGEPHIVRVIKKKDEPKDAVGTFKVEEDGTFKFKEYGQ